MTECGLDPSHDVGLCMKMMANTVEACLSNHLETFGHRPFMPIGMAALHTPDRLKDGKAPLVQQIMHGATIAEDLTGRVPSPPPLRVSNGHAATNGNGSTVELTTPSPQQPIRPK